MCVPTLRSIGTKLKKLENMQKSYFYFTSRKAKTVEASMSEQHCFSGIHEFRKVFSSIDVVINHIHMYVS